MRYSLDGRQCANLSVSKRREWLLTNGLGGYAMGTPCGANTRRYHGLLVAAVHPPADRMVLLANVDAFIQSGLSNPIGVSVNQYQGALYPEGHLYLRSFHVDEEAAWGYRAGDLEVERSLRMHPGENAITLEYANVGSHPFTLTLRPLVCHKRYHENFGEHPEYPERTEFESDRCLVEDRGVPLWLIHPQAERTPVQGWYYRFEHEEELVRGLDPRDDLYCPCELRYELNPGESAILVASMSEDTAPRTRPAAPSPSTALGDQLRPAAERFIVETPTRTTIIAGFPWFADWGRDTMIALPGILLHTGHVAAARRLLLDYAAAMRDGLIPNRFTEDGGADYHTVDASLWFVYAVHKTLSHAWDAEFGAAIAPRLRDLLEAHVAGTRFGIRMDPEDGLITQGEPGLQLTWMDAKIGDWVVTPRHGKPVEVNGLWVNALRSMAWLEERLGRGGECWTSRADQAAESFEEKFWHEGRGHYADTIDPMDVSLRPNQVIAMGLPFTPVAVDHARRALDVVERELLTPVGLRTLGPREPGYRGRYDGPLPELDAAYHQGTVWPWLLGPYCSAVVRFRGDRSEAKRILKGAREMLSERGLGGISEVYDGDEPRRPGGCPWQAWSVAEILRSWCEDAAKPGGGA